MVTDKRKQPRILRFLDVALCWRHMKLLTMFGAILGIAAFIEVNKALHVLIPGVLLIWLLIMGIIREFILKQE